MNSIKAIVTDPKLMYNEFIREQRYFVVKIKNAEDAFKRYCERGYKDRRGTQLIH